MKHVQERRKRPRYCEVSLLEQSPVFLVYTKISDPSVFFFGADAKARFIQTDDFPHQNPSHATWGKGTDARKHTTQHNPQ